MPVKGHKSTLRPNTYSSIQRITALEPQISLDRGSSYVLPTASLSTSIPFITFLSALAPTLSLTCRSLVKTSTTRFSYTRKPPGLAVCLNTVLVAESVTITAASMYPLGTPPRSTSRGSLRPRDPRFPYGLAPPLAPQSMQDLPSTASFKPAQEDNPISSNTTRSRSLSLSSQSAPSVGTTPMQDHSSTTLQSAVKASLTPSASSEAEIRIKVHRLRRFLL